MRVCHCRNCQKAMGSPFFARALYDQRALTVSGDTGRYPSSEHLERVFCKQCGTRLFSWRRNGTAAGVALAAFDDRNAFTPTEHIWVSEKIAWVRLDDGLPHNSRKAPLKHEFFRGRGSVARNQTGAAPRERHPLRVLRLGLAACDRDHLSRGRSWLCRPPSWRQYRVGAGPRQLQSTPSHRSLRYADLAGDSLMSHSPFLFGYAKPVPVNFRALRHPRIDMVWVALAGPATNIALALVAAALFIRGPLPDNSAQWVADNLKNALVINVVLAVFNMLPIPPLDGGRVAVGLLPRDGGAAFAAGTVRDADPDRAIDFAFAGRFAVRSKS